MIAALACLVVALSPDTYAIRLKTGDSWTVEEDWRFIDPSNHSDLDHSIRKVIYRIEKGDATGYDVEVSILLVSTIVGEETIPPPTGLKPWILKERWLPNGIVVEPPFDFEHLQEARLWRLTRLPMPELPGYEGAWKYEMPGTKAINSPAFSLGIKAKLVKADKNPSTARWDLTELETNPINPMKGVGKATVDIATGLIQDLSWSVHNAPLPGGTDPADLELKAKVTKPIKL